MMHTYSGEDEALVPFPDMERQRRLQEAKGQLARLDDAMMFQRSQLSLYRRKKADLIVKIEALQNARGTS